VSQRRLNVTPAEAAAVQKEADYTQPAWTEARFLQFMKDYLGVEPGAYRLCIRFDLDRIPTDQVPRIEEGLVCPECNAPVPWEWADACRRRMEEYTLPIHREPIHGTEVRFPLPVRPCGHFDMVELRCRAWADWGEVRAYTYGDHFAPDQPPIIPTRRRSPWSG
jgi:hypothetical protein